MAVQTFTPVGNLQLPRSLSAGPRPRRPQAPGPTPAAGAGALAGAAAVHVPTTNLPILLPGAGVAGQPAAAPRPGTFGPGNDARFTTVAPTPSAAASGWQGMLGGAVSSAMSPVNIDSGRMGMVNQALADYDTENQPRLQESFQQIGRRSAALGRGGSGMTDRDIGNAGASYERNRLLARNSLLRDAMESDMGDRFARVGMLSGLYGQQSGIDAGARGEQRTERDYQYGVGEDARTQAIQAQLLGDQLYGSQFNRNLALAGAGNPNVLASYLGGAAAQGHASAGDFYSGAGGLLGDWFSRRRTMPTG